MGRFVGNSIYGNSDNDGDRDLAKKAGGFTAKNDSDQEAAYKKLKNKYGERGAKQRVETEARSAGAKPKGVWNKLTGR